MTRLSIQSRNANDGVSIHLRPGQSCTLGSGAAADFRLPDPNLPALFCRIQCQISGGYIECLQPDDSLVVNQRTKIRSRLVHGDTLKIGTITLEVTRPETQAAANPEFHVNFEDEEPESTLSDDPLPFDPELESFDEESFHPPNLPNFSDEEVETADIFDDDQPPVALPPSAPASREPVFKFEKSDFDEETEQSPDEDSAPEPPEETSAAAPEDEPQETTPPPRETREPTAPPKFSFDSTDPDDIDEQDLQAAFDDDNEIEAFPTMSISIADAASSGESDSISVAVDHDVDLNLLDSPFDEQANVGDGFTLAGGSDAGKFIRWGGDVLPATLEHLLDTKTRINLFSCRGIQTQSLPLSSIIAQNYLQHDNEIYLLTELTMHQLQDQIRNHRWDDRMGHPRALRMFLEYAPGSTIKQFFKRIDAVLLVEDREPCLLRINRKLK